MESLIADIELKNRRWKQSMGVVVAVFMMAMAYLVIANYQNGIKLNSQVKDLKTIQDNQARAVEQLNSSVDGLKADNEKNLKIIICMLHVPINQRTENVETSCRNQAEAPASPTNAGSPPVTAPSTSNPQPEPSPSSPPPKITKTITNFVSKTLKKIGL